MEDIPDMHDQGTDRFPTVTLINLAGGNVIPEVL